VIHIILPVRLSKGTHKQNVFQKDNDPNPHKNSIQYYDKFMQLYEIFNLSDYFQYFLQKCFVIGFYLII
jgi:hypothetical protein